MTGARPKLHVGITPWDLARNHSARWLSEQAVFAEELGFDSFFLPENHFGGRGSLPDPLMLLAAVSTVTSNIKLGTTSLLLPVRHPLQAAEQVAVLDQLSNGRVILGLGRGNAPSLFRAFDVDRKHKRRKFEHCLSVMRQAWRGESVVDGEEGAITLDPLPIQQPEPPLWVAAFGPKALAQVGRLGLPYLASPMEPIAALESNYAHLAAAAATSGLSVPSVVPVMRTVFVSRDREELERVRELIREQMRTAITSVIVDPNARIEDRIILGTPEEVQAQIERYREAVGMTHLIATRLRVTGVDDGCLRNSLRLLAELRRDLA